MNAAPLQHPNEETLRDYGLGKLDAVAAEATHRHLEACAECRRRVAVQPADSFLDRFRDHRPGESRGPGAPAAAETLPPGPADHPDYEIRRELGRGGMGVVYLAHNRLMGREEVLKVMGPEIVARPGVADRFIREIRAVARLRHPNIVAAYSVVRLGESIAFAMEYIPGLDLARMVKIKGPLPVAHACRFAHQAALGLQHAHEAGLVHRDVKPSNLILSHDGDRAAVKVLDFGLTKGSHEAREEVDGALTRSGQALGTPDYIAPEQILDATSADFRADVYSLGATLFFLLAGRPPFRAKSLYDLYQAHISRLPDPMDQIRPDVPAGLAALIAKMMAKDPEQRFQTPKEVAQALAPFFKGRIAAPDRSSPGTPQPTAVETSQAGPDSAFRAASSPALASVAGPATAPEILPVVEPSVGRRWGLPAAAGVGVLLAALAIAWILGVFKATTSEGTLVLRNLPEDAEVSVDGQRFVFTWPGLDQPLEIRAVPGGKRLEVTKGGFTAFATDLSLKPGGREEVSIRLEPLAEPPVAAAAFGEPGDVQDQTAEVPVSSPSAPLAIDERAVVAATDLLKVGAVWRGEQILTKPSVKQSDITLTIDSRDGDGFEGVLSFTNGWSAGVRGTVSGDGTIRWGYTRVITWVKDTPESRKKVARLSLARYRATGALSIPHRTIWAEFVRPGQPEGDLEGTIRLELTGDGEPPQGPARTSEAPAVAARAPAAMADALMSVGSLWEGEQNREKPQARSVSITLKVTRREGETFEGVVRLGNGYSTEARGTISGDGAIRWGYTKVVNWPPTMSEEERRIDASTVPNFKASGSLSVSDRTIRAEFVRPGQMRGDVEGKIRLKLSEHED